MMAVAILVAVFVFGAPPWILVPVMMGTASLYIRLRLRAERRLEHR